MHGDISEIICCRSLQLLRERLFLFQCVFSIESFVDPVSKYRYWYNGLSIQPLLLYHTYAYSLDVLKN